MQFCRTTDGIPVRNPECHGRTEPDSVAVHAADRANLSLALFLDAYPFLMRETLGLPHVRLPGSLGAVLSQGLIAL